MSNHNSGNSNGFRDKLPKILLLATAFFSVRASGGAWGAWQNLCVDCPSIAQISTWEPEQTSKILSHDGRLVAEIGLERRTPGGPGGPPGVRGARLSWPWRTDGSIPITASIIRGILRSVVRVVVNRSFAGGGGSTITQQLARNMFEERIGREKRIARKLKELQVALALENTYYEGPDPGSLHQPDQLRPGMVRDPDRFQELLREERQRGESGRGGNAGRHPQPPRLLQSPPEPGERPPAAGTWP